MRTTGAKAGFGLLLLAGSFGASSLGLAGCAEGTDIIGRRGMGGGTDTGSDPSVPVADAAAEPEPDASSPVQLDTWVPLGALTADEALALCEVAASAFDGARTSDSARRSACTEEWLRREAGLASYASADEAVLACKADVYACLSEGAVHEPSGCGAEGASDARLARYSSRACAGVTVAELGACVSEVLGETAALEGAWQCDSAFTAAAAVAAADALEPNISAKCAALTAACL
jgi:hypothetical protein